MTPTIDEIRRNYHICKRVGWCWEVPEDYEASLWDTVPVRCIAMLCDRVEQLEAAARTMHQPTENCKQEPVPVSSVGEMSIAAAPIEVGDPLYLDESGQAHSVPAESKVDAYMKAHHATGIHLDHIWPKEF